MVKEVENLGDLIKIIDEAGSKTIIIDFFAEWCGPCKAISPKVAELANSHPNIIVLKVDVDKAADIGEKYDITAMPTFKVIKNKQVVDTVIGGNPDRVVDLFNKHK